MGFRVDKIQHKGGLLGKGKEQKEKERKENEKKGMKRKGTEAVIHH